MYKITVDNPRNSSNGINLNLNNEKDPAPLIDTCRDKYATRR